MSFVIVDRLAGYDAMTNSGDYDERRIFGPPGTGKTTELSRRIGEAATRYAGGVMVCAFTRAAAAELVGKGIAVDDGRIGTIHSFAKRSLPDGVKIIEACPKPLKLWNEGRGRRDGWHVAEKKATAGESNSGSEVHAAFEVARHRLVDVSDETALRSLARSVEGASMRAKPAWPIYREVPDFAAAWEAHKAEHECTDFTGLLEQCFRSKVAPELLVRAIYVDEAQDLTPLEIGVIRTWAQELRVSELVLAGDDDQTLYEWRGADPRAMTDHAGDVEVEVLQQSHRVPERIREYADRWIRQSADRFPKEYRGAREGGVIAQRSCRLSFMDSVVTEVRKELKREEVTDLMVLAASNHSVGKVAKALKAEGIPFHNPYRRDEGAWNPLTSTARLLGLFLRTDPTEDALELSVAPEFRSSDLTGWTWHEVRDWMQAISSDAAGMVHDAKKQIADMACDIEQGALPVTARDFESVTGIAPPEPDPDWFREHALKARKNGALDFAVNVAKREGPLALISEPRVILGTIHSVKGGSADSVLVFPDLTPRQATSLVAGSPGRDSDPIVRLFYVAFTRARKRLLLGNYPRSHFVRWLAPSVAPAGTV